MSRWNKNSKKYYSNYYDGYTDRHIKKLNKVFDLENESNSENSNKEQNKPGFLNGYDINIACLGQTTMSVNEEQKIITDWTAGTLNYDEEKKQWSCPLDKYFYENK